MAKQLVVIPTSHVINTNPRNTSQNHGSFQQYNYAPRHWVHLYQNFHSCIKFKFSFTGQFECSKFISALGCLLLIFKENTQLNYVECV